MKTVAIERIRLLGMIAGIGVMTLTTTGMVLSEFELTCAPETPCPTLEQLAEGRGLDEAVHIHDRFGAPLAHVGGAKRMTVAYDRLPPLLRDAFVAVEDRRYWEHQGVDHRGVVRAGVRNVLEGQVTEGASTIPMQLVRTVWAEALSEVGPWERKMVEARLAPRLVRELGHERVLELYLNGIYLGDGIYGVEAAARHYFGRSVDQLDVAEIATLVGMTKTPGRYNPRRSPDRARTRRDVVLGILEREGVVDPLAAEMARARPVATVDSSGVSFRRSHVTAAVRRELGRVAPELIGVPGLRVFTTIDPRVQRAAERALDDQLKRIEEGRFGAYLGPEAARTDTLPDARLQGAALAVDTHTGAVLALVGGRDFGRSELDRAMQSRRQVGSLVKPMLLASAYASGRQPTDPVSTDTVYMRTDEGVWSPADHVGVDTLPMRDLVVRSSNRAAVRVGRDIGLERLALTARALGVDRRIPHYPSSFLGAFEASLADMTAAFAAFENGGWRIRPHVIERVEDPDGRVLYERPRDVTPPRAVDPVTAWLVLDAMRGVVDGGTAWRIREAYRGPAAGKTGTTDDGRDAWFVGLRPGLAAGVWVGFDMPRPIARGGSGGTLAAPAWGHWMAALPDSLLAGEWSPPPGVRSVRYDVDTGRVVPDDCPHLGSTRRITVREDWGWSASECPAPDLPDRLLRTEELDLTAPGIRMPDLDRRRGGGGG